MKRQCRLRHRTKERTEELQMDGCGKHQKKKKKEEREKKKGKEKSHEKQLFNRDGDEQRECVGVWVRERERRTKPADLYLSRHCRTHSGDAVV